MSVDNEEVIYTASGCNRRKEEVSHCHFRPNTHILPHHPSPIVKQLEETSASCETPSQSTHIPLSPWKLPEHGLACTSQIPPAAKRTNCGVTMTSSFSLSRAQAEVWLIYNPFSRLSSPLSTSPVLQLCECFSWAVCGLRPWLAWGRRLACLGSEVVLSRWRFSLDRYQRNCHGSPQNRGFGTYRIRSLIPQNQPPPTYKSTMSNVDQEAINASQAQGGGIDPKTGTSGEWFSNLLTSLSFLLIPFPTLSCCSIPFSLRSPLPLSLNPFLLPSTRSDPRPRPNRRAIRSRPRRLPQASRLKRRAITRQQHRRRRQD